MECPSCGGFNEDCARFCCHCGVKFSSRINHRKTWTWICVCYIVITTFFLFFKFPEWTGALMDATGLSEFVSSITIAAIAIVLFVIGLIQRRRVWISVLLCPLLFNSGVYVVLSFVKQNISVESYSRYTQKNVTIIAGSSCKDVGQEELPQLAELDDKYGIGGVKLIPEMSVDKSPNLPPTSSFIEDEDLEIKEPSELQLDPIESDENVISHIIVGDVTIDMGNVCGGWGSPMSIPTTLTNHSPKTIKCSIEQGQMVEVQAPDVQNLTVFEPVSVELYPKETQSITLKTWCASRHRKSPLGFKAKITPFKLNASADAFETQETLWNFQTPSRNDYERNYTLTFYAYGKGTQMPGGISKFGHAFVDIPSVGTCGVGIMDRDRGYVNNESVAITDQSRSVQYATRRYSINISGVQLEEVKKKYWEWKTHPPHYTLGLRDCTSFVMDIADAAGINYGWRTSIQTPIGFLDSLKEHNR